MSLENSSGRGVLSHYNSRATEGKYGRTYTTKGSVKQAEWVVDLAKEITGAPTTSQELLVGGATNLGQVIPAYSKILSCRVYFESAVATVGGSAASSAALTVGLEESDGTAIDIDGLVDATDGALTIASNDIVGVRGAYLQGGSAALVPDYGTAATPAEKVSIGAENGELYMLLVIDDITGMTSISGVLRVVVEYVPQGGSAA